MCACWILAESAFLSVGSLELLESPSDGEKHGEGGQLWIRWVQTDPLGRRLWSTELKKPERGQPREDLGQDGHRQRGRGARQEVVQGPAHPRRGREAGARECVDPTPQGPF